MYGTPAEAVAPLRTLTLDLPAALAWTADPQQNAGAALYLLGPVVAGADLDSLPRLEPASVSYTVGSTVVHFTFADLIAPGSYRVVVLQSRLKDMSGNTIELLDELGEPWTGWDLLVIPGVRSFAEPGVQEPLVLRPTNPPLVRVVDDNQFTVRLDGTAVPAGKSVLSGEVLTVETTNPADITLEVEYLMRGQTMSLYELYLHRILEPADGGLHRTHFVSVGPVWDAAWAVYYGHRTDGTLPIDSETNQLVVWPGVVTTPKPITSSPRITLTSEEVAPQGHPNTYTKVSYTVTPLKDPNLASYTSLDLIYPKVLVDADDTPIENPRMFPGGVYFPTMLAPTEDDTVASYDLPINCRIRIYANGTEIWWGQTRLVPMLVSSRRFFQLRGGRPFSHAEISDIELQVMRASVEALTLWKCVLPTSVTSTMEEYVLTRLAYGWPLEDSSTGAYMVRLGDHMFSGTSDDMLHRRLSNLADLLARCVADAPIFPDDEMPAAVAMVASASYLKQYPSVTRTSSSWLWPIHDVSIPRHLRLTDLFDPIEYGRRLQ